MTVTLHVVILADIMVVASCLFSKSLYTDLVHKLLIQLGVDDIVRDGTRGPGKALGFNLDAWSIPSM